HGKHYQVAADFDRLFPGGNDEPDPERGRSDADEVENDTHRCIAPKDGRLEYHAAEIQHGIPEKHFAAQFGFRLPHQYFHAHGDDQERLMVVEANAVREKRPVKIPVLVWRIDPSHQEHHDAHQRNHAQRINLDDHRLAPHVAVESNQTAGD